MKNPAASCEDILAKDSSAPSGKYYVQLTSQVIQVQIDTAVCDILSGLGYHPYSEDKHHLSVPLHTYTAYTRYVTCFCADIC